MRRPAPQTSAVPTLFEFLRQLEAVNAGYRLGRIRHESVLVEVDAPGEHWEVEFMEDGTLEIERFRSPGGIADHRALPELWELFTPPTPVRPKARRVQTRGASANRRKTRG